MLLIACFKTDGAPGLLHFELNYNKHFNSVVWSVGRWTDIRIQSTFHFSNSFISIFNLDFERSFYDLNEIAQRNVDTNKNTILMIQF